MGNEDAVEEVDITDALSDDQIQELFSSFNNEDWAGVDRLIESFEAAGVYSLPDEKAGGADRNKGQAEKLRRYWTVGEGAAKIRWGSKGDWTRCVEHLSKYLGPRAKGYCALRHREVLGYYPGDSRNKSLLRLSPVVLSHASAAVPPSSSLERSDLALVVTPLTDLKASTLPDVPPSDILSVGDQFKVLGVDAVAYAAEVVNFHSIDQRADVEGVCQLVRADERTFKSLDSSVPFAVYGSNEQPTLFSLLDLRLKALFGVTTLDGASSVSHIPTTPESMRVSATQTALFDRAIAVGRKALTHGGIVAYVTDEMMKNKSALVSENDDSSTYHEHKDDEQPESGVEMLEHKTVGVKGMNVVSDEEGIVETIISVTGVVDKVKDFIEPGAYAKTLAARTPKGVWSHDWDTPVSKTLEVRELMPGDPDLPSVMPNGSPWPEKAGALKVKTQFNLTTQRGADAYSDVKFFGDEQEWSIGYNVPVGGAKVDQKTGVRYIKTLDLFEYSPVLFGAMPLARTTSVKQAQMAFKALMSGGAAAWLADAEDETEEKTDVVEVAEVDEPVEEYEAPTITEAEEELTEALEGVKFELPVDDRLLVKRAVETLQDLLSVIQGDDYGTKGADMDSDEEVVEPAPEESDEPVEYDSLSELVEDVVTDDQVADELYELASAVDDALDGGDPGELETASKAFLDRLESLMSADGADTEDLQEVSSQFAALIDNIPDEEPPASEDNTEKKSEVCPDCGESLDECACEEKSLLSVEEMTAFLNDLSQ